MRWTGGRQRTRGGWLRRREPRPNMRPTRRVLQLVLAFPGGLLRPVPVRRRFRRILGASGPHHQNQSMCGERVCVCVPPDLLKAYHYCLPPSAASPRPEGRDSGPTPPPHETCFGPGGPVSTVRGYCDPEVPPDARRAAEAAGAQAKYEAYKEGDTAGSCLSRGVAPPGAGPA